MTQSEGVMSPDQSKTNDTHVEVLQNDDVDSVESSRPRTLEDLLELLQFAVLERSTHGDQFADSNGAVRQQEQGMHHEASKFADRIRELVEQRAPDCKTCDIQLDLIRDDRFSEEWRWDCRHCPHEDPVRGDSDV